MVLVGAAHYGPEAAVLHVTVDIEQACRFPLSAEEGGEVALLAVVQIVGVIVKIFGVDVVSEVVSIVEGVGEVQDGGEPAAVPLEVASTSV